MKKIITAAAIAGAGIAAAIIGSAAPAQAAPSYGCAPCVSIPGVPGWEKITGNGPWETIFPAGEGATGPWNNAFSNDTWGNTVKAVTGGAWEKAFPPAS